MYELWSLIISTCLIEMLRDTWWYNSPSLLQMRTLPRDIQKPTLTFLLPPVVWEEWYNGHTVYPQPPNWSTSSHSGPHHLIICLTNVITFEYNPKEDSICLNHALFSLSHSVVNLGNNYFNDLIKIEHTERLNFGNM